MQLATSSMSVVDLRQHDVPACVKHFPRKVPESQSWVGARQVLGRRRLFLGSVPL